MIADDIWRQGPAVVNAHIRDLIARAVPPIPEQQMAPIRVEERDGKIARISDEDSGLRADDLDFEGWREPVLDHVNELLNGDFRSGTNHGRVWDRLEALAALLPGAIPEVEAQQFRIGYEIERLEGLLAAYRSGSEDMPELNAAVLEDLGRLHLALKMGIEKLERWADFRRQAIESLPQVAEVDRAVVADAIDTVVVEMALQSKFFNAELPRSFGYLIKALRDPRGATKVIVYGAATSVENVIAFLGRTALGVAKGGIEDAAKVITKALAATLLAGLSAAAFSISQAVPGSMPWLLPLLETLKLAAKR